MTTDTKPDINGWAIEIRRSHYYRNAQGKVVRDYHDSHYCGSLTEPESKRLFALLDGEFKSELTS